MNYLSWLYWFNSRPEPLSKQDLNIVLLVVVILVVIGIAGYIGALSRLNISRRVIGKITTFAFVNAFIALLVVFLNYELIPYLRARIIYVIWAAAVIIWIYHLIPTKRKPNQNIDSSREAEIKKYLPN